jgi:hypothetical protein
MRPCTICGLDMDLVGKSHRCVPRVAPVANNEPRVANSEALVANKSTPAPASKHYSGRYRDVEKRRSYMREFMRKKRLVRRSQRRRAAELRQA